MACLEVSKNLEWDNIWIKTDGMYLNNLLFKDSIVPSSESVDSLQKITEEHNKDFKVSLKMNMKKRWVMFNNQIEGQKIMIGNETLE